MKISIITISYNSASTIRSTLNSVINQTYKNVEHIVVDGGSIDNTIEICNNYPHISKIISEKDKGVYDAFNKGLSMSTGEIIGFLNSDDIFDNNDTLRIIVDEFNKDIDAVFGNLKYYNKKGKVVRVWKANEYKKNSFQKGWMPPHPTFYCKKVIYDKYGNYDDSFKIAGDFELMLRLIEVYNIKTSFINNNLIRMKTGGISNSGVGSKVIILKEQFRAFRINKISINRLLYIISKLKKIKEFL
tara:strand:+ start:9299 stop:10030 length:732 start_codon:yes stop_codon:yes gene_type:complete